MTNKYLTLKDDEKKIFQLFTNQFNIFINELESVCEKFKSRCDGEKLFEETLNFDKKNINIANDISDECV